MKQRKLLKITGRTSSVTNSFVQAIIPSIEGSAEERREALAVLGMAEESIQCVYCGSAATDWDHLRPLVRDRRPTGYINEIRNLVPACAPCNQSKGGSDWRTWINGHARGSPKTKKVSDLAQRVDRLEAFEAWAKVTPLPLAEMAGAELWDQYWNQLTAIDQLMVAAQAKAGEVQAAIRLAMEAAQDSAAPAARPQASLPQANMMADVAPPPCSHSKTRKPDL